MSLCSCLLLSSPCLRIIIIIIIDAFGVRLCVCVRVCWVCVCVHEREGRAELAAGLSCKLSQRLKQRGDERRRGLLRMACRCDGGGLSWPDGRFFLRGCSRRFDPFFFSFFFTAFTPTHPRCHTNTHLYTLTVKHPDLLLLTDFSALSYRIAGQGYSGA